MNRTFHYRASWVNYLAVSIVAATALFFFWNRSAANAAVGFVLVMAALLMVERIVHTVYTFTSDGMLLICRGRLSRPIAIPVGDIIKAKAVRHALLPVRFVVVEYGIGRIITVQPADEEAFVREIERRQTQGLDRQKTD